jgi:hypothetical protein
MKNIIFIIAILFSILNMISKSKKKQQQVAERIRKRNEQIKTPGGTGLQPIKRLPEEILLLSQTTQGLAPAATDYESAYASDDYAADKKKAEEVIQTKAEPLSHYQKNYGMDNSYTIGSESAEEKEAYNKDVKLVPSLVLTNSAIKQYIVASEIFGKPKALRRR